MLHIEKLTLLARMRLATLKTAYQCLELQLSIGDFHFKTEIAKMSASLVQSGQAFDRRLSFLSHAPTPLYFSTGERDDRSKPIELEDVLRSIRDLRTRTRRGLRALAGVHDDKSRDLFADLERRLSNYAAILKAWRSALVDGHVPYQKDQGLIRDCYVVQSLRQKPIYRDLDGFTEAMRSLEARAAYISSNAYLEIASLDILSDLSLIALRESRFALLFDLSHQLQDESRHAELLSTRLNELGYDLGFVPIELETWRLYRSFESLAQRIAAQQVLQEGLGLDASHMNIPAMKAAGDPITADLYAQITADEVNHVALGMKWLSVLSNEDPVEILRATDRTCNRVLARPLHLPIVRELRAKARVPREWIDEQGLILGVQSFQSLALGGPVG